MKVNNFSDSKIREVKKTCSKDALTYIELLEKHLKIRMATINQMIKDKRGNNHA
jgi:hypothetical protein